MYCIFKKHRLVQIYADLKFAIELFNERVISVS